MCRSHTDKASNLRLGTSDSPCGFTRIDLHVAQCGTCQLVVNSEQTVDIILLIVRENIEALLLIKNVLIGSNVLKKITCTSFIFTPLDSENYESVP